MESVHVFFFVDGGNDAVFVDVIRQRQLHQDAVHALIGIQVGNQRQQLLLGNAGRPQDGGILDSHDLAGLTLAPHIGLAGRVLPYQNHHQMRHAAIFLREQGHLLRHFGLHLGREFFSTDYPCHTHEFL